MAKGKAAKAAGAAGAVKTSPYVQRLVQDETVREDFRDAYESAQKAYARLSNGKSPQKALLDDKKLQRELQAAATSLRDATQALREGPQKKKGRGIGGTLMIIIVGAIVALAVSEDLRNKVLDLLFGKEEEFEYTSTTSPVTPPPSSTATAT